jgi:DNA-directed RNA polymerase subunit RPC12/RpoP
MKKCYRCEKCKNYFYIFTIFVHETIRCNWCGSSEVKLVE